MIIDLEIECEGDWDVGIDIKSIYMVNRKKYLIKQSPEKISGLYLRINYRGMFPCFLRGLFTTLFSSILNALINFSRV